MDGVLLVNKERGWTSRDVCNKIQSILHTKSIGHTGTLDPFAEGLLLVTVNKATKITPYCDNYHKTYVATLTLGQETDTGDLNGNIIKEKEVPELNEQLIKETLNKFLGKISQIPPMTSAIHVNGRKLYEMAHQGEYIERAPREVEIYQINLISFNSKEITFEAEVSKGTYLRVLGEDIAKELNTVGHLSKLVRTKIDKFDVKDALKIDEIKEDSPLYSVSKVLTHLEKGIVGFDYVQNVKDGKRMYFVSCHDEQILVTDPNDVAIAIYERENDKGLYHCLRGLW